MFLDTSIIIEIFKTGKDSKKFEEIYSFIKDKPLFMSIIQIGEISDWCLKNRINPRERIDKLKKIMNIIPLNEKICIEGSQIKYKMRKKKIGNFSLIDGLILASARSINQELITIDNDFQKAKDVILL